LLGHNTKLNNFTMKKILKIFVLIAAVSLFGVTVSKAQSIAISVALHRPHEYDRNERERPNRPSPNHVWINEEWVVRGGRYVYQPGYWAPPPPRAATWVPGRWDPSPTWRGRYVWVAGHWHYN